MASFKPPARSRRRLDLARMKAKCRRIYPHDKNAQWAEHLQGCSCWSCGNRRRSEGLSMQERKAEAAARTQVDELV